jgi:hypothetical protein
MRKVIALIGTVGMAFTGTNLAIAQGTDNTQVQVHALAKTESQVVALLHGFKDTATWKAQYQAALTAQSTAVANLNADLFPVVEQNTLTWTTDKSTNTPPFSVNGTFTLSWTTSPQSGSSCNEGVYVLVFVFPEAAKVSTGDYSAGPFEQDNCHLFSTQVSGISGEQYLDISVGSASATVTVSGPIAP